MTSFPVIAKPDDLIKLLKELAIVPPPDSKIEDRFFKQFGFSASSMKALMEVLKAIGFVTAENEPSEVWRSYSGNKNPAAVLATAIKNTYPDLFRFTACPYLESDGEILDILKRGTKVSARDANLMLDAFRTLSELADFQDLLCGETPSPLSPPVAAGELPVKVNPNLQLNIQVHIDPGTPDEKIEAIFRNMRKYLLDKGDG